jgi:hypothetical protein
VSKNSKLRLLFSILHMGCSGLEPGTPCAYVEQVPLGTHTIPKLIFDIDKSAYYKAILAIFLRIDFCIFRCQNKQNHPSGCV